MNSLANKIAVVVGGVGGIGGAISQRFAAEGAQVYATSRSAPDASAGAQAPSSTNGAGVRIVRADASRRADLRQVFEGVRTEHGGIDVLVVNAGAAAYATLDGVDEAHFDSIFGLNVRAMVFAAQDALELMRPGGAIVLVGSIAGDIGTKGYGVYGASKAAVRAFARTWANELAPQGIRVNVVSPGPTDTSMFDAVSDEIRAEVTALVPLGRLGRPEEVAAAALFLAGDESSFVTGAELCVDGGMAQV
jgi:NAD(P)-dependent dehydrogenase (short-subunit alcohol dehydrogenase family)